jgi:hemerythrin-like domain-containing protein
MNPMYVLKNEHRVIERMLNSLQKMIRKKINFSDALKMVDFFKTFADKCHHEKEEGILFPEMEKAGVPREGGPIGVMLTEHNIGREFIKGMEKAIEEKDEEKFIQNAEEYIDLLKDHIFKEDNILFEMAEVNLDRNKKQEIFERFEEFEKNTIGKGIHETYHKLVEDMQKIYSD